MKKQNRSKHTDGHVRRGVVVVEPFLGGEHVTERMDFVNAQFRRGEASNQCEPNES